VPSEGSVQETECRAPSARPMTANPVCSRKSYLSVQLNQSVSELVDDALGFTRDIRSARLSEEAHMDPIVEPSEPAYPTPPKSYAAPMLPMPPAPRPLAGQARSKLASFQQPFRHIDRNNNVVDISRGVRPSWPSQRPMTATSGCDHLAVSSPGVVLQDGILRSKTGHAVPATVLSAPADVGLRYTQLVAPSEDVREPAETSLDMRGSTFSKLITRPHFVRNQAPSQATGTNVATLLAASSAPPDSSQHQAPPGPSHHLRAGPLGTSPNDGTVSIRHQPNAPRVLLAQMQTARDLAAPSQPPVPAPPAEEGPPRGKMTDESGPAHVHGVLVDGVIKSEIGDMSAALLSAPNKVHIGGSNASTLDLERRRPPTSKASNGPRVGFSASPLIQSLGRTMSDFKDFHGSQTSRAVARGALTARTAAWYGKGTNMGGIPVLPLPGQGRDRAGNRGNTNRGAWKESLSNLDATTGPRYCQTTGSSRRPAHGAVVSGIGEGGYWQSKVHGKGEAQPAPGVDCSVLGLRRMPGRVTISRPTGTARAPRKHPYGAEARRRTMTSAWSSEYKGKIGADGPVPIICGAYQSHS